METKQATSDKSKRLIDANEYPCQSCTVSYCYQNCPKFIAWFEKTVDAVEVVRCKDCKNCKTEQVTIPGPYPSRSYTMYTCSHPKQEFGNEPLDIEPDDFCSYGERRASDG